MVTGSFPSHGAEIRWIGVDLNTTGHAVVAAEPVSGKVIRLGKNIRSRPNQASKSCTKLYREGKLWKLKRYKSRERKVFRAALNAISWQVVSFAEGMCAGIKLERLFSDSRLRNHRYHDGQYEFSFENGSFVSLQILVEGRARERGIPVIYVDPANTSRRCSRCGGFGRRMRKRFECPCCGSIIHADVNAAFNIAMTSRNLPIEFSESHSLSCRKVRKVART